MIEKLTKAPDGKRSIKQFYLKNIRLFDYDPKENKRRLAEKAANRENRPVLCIRKQSEKLGNRAATL